MPVSFRLGGILILAVAIFIWLTVAGSATGVPSSGVLMNISVGAARAGLRFFLRDRFVKDHGPARLFVESHLGHDDSRDPAG